MKDFAEGIFATCVMLAALLIGACVTKPKPATIQPAPASMKPASKATSPQEVEVVAVPSFIAPHEFSAYADDESRCWICGHGKDGHFVPEPEPFDFNCPTCKGAGLYHGAICPTCDGASNALRPKHLSELKSPPAHAPAYRPQPATVPRQYVPVRRRIGWRFGR